MSSLAIILVVVGLLLGGVGILSVANIIIFQKRVKRMMSKFDKVFGVNENLIFQALPSPITKLEVFSTLFSFLASLSSLILLQLCVDYIFLVLAIIMTTSSGITLYQLHKTVKSGMPYVLPKIVRYYAGIYPIMGLIAFTYLLFETIPL